MAASVKAETSTPTTFQRWFGRSKLYEYEVILFGFALVLGNRNFAWNFGLSYGYDVVATNTIFVGSAFFCLCLCMGEMTSALPFSGGIFGFVRAATGPYYGYIVACFEMIFCLTNLIVIMRFCVLIPVVAGIVTEDYTPNLIFIVYGFILFMNLLGGKPFWSLVSLLGFGTFVLLLIFLCGTLRDVNKSNVDFKVYCERNIPVTFKAMMEERWLAVSQFQGLQYLPLLSEYVKEPRKSIPRAMMVCATEFICFSIFVSLAACSTYPGEFILQMVLTPLMFGYQHIFNTDIIRAVWLHFPGLFAPTLTFLFCSGRQLYMIAKSGLLPSFLTFTTPGTGTPALTLMIAAIVGASINLSIYYYPIVGDQMVSIIVLSSHVVFMNAFVAYLFFRKKYSSMPRSFTSPLGIWGALYGLANNAIGVVSVIKYSGTGEVSYTLWLLLAYFGAATIFYWTYMVKHQKFSEEEKKLMFKAYLINANREKMRRIFRNNKVANHGASTATNTNKPSMSSIEQNTNAAIVPCQVETAHNSSHEETNSDSPHGSSLRPAETVASSHKPDPTSFSAKLIGYISSKMNAVAPAEELNEYQQLAVLSAGGIIEASEEAALQERLGLNDVEACMDGIDGNNAEEAIQT